MTQALQTTETGIQAAVRRAGTQAGISLLELIAALTVIAAIIVGALALYTSASTTQSSSQLIQDLVSIRSAVRQLHQGQGTYGTAGLNTVLVRSGRLPSTVRVVNANTGVINHLFNDDIVVTGATATFTIRLDLVPREACINLLTSASGWTQIVTPGGTIQGANLPVAATNAVQNCNQATNNMTFSSN